MTPRVLFVSRERFRLPLDGAQERKWDAVARVVDHRVLAVAPEGWPTIERPIRRCMVHRFPYGILYFTLSRRAFGFWP